ncbi:MAG TPA: cell division protein FtsA [Candidatus Magasanikbacteria bacterium]|nr:cell division protein FtsA [Candidatus Magasanikbacteria bacterium]
MRRTAQNLLVGLDIGSQAVRLAVGNLILHKQGLAEVQILGCAEAPSEGLSKGVITNIEDVVSSVSSCLEQAEHITGTPIESVFVGIPGAQTLIQNSRGYSVVSKADNEITESDKWRAVESSKSVATPLNYEVLHVTPRSFIVDGQGGIKEPVGMTGVRLEVDTKIILGQSSQIKNLTRAVYRTGVDIDGMVLSLIAIADTVLSPKQKELGVVLVNLGATTTSLIVYEEGELLHLAVIPVGGVHITNDLAVGLRNHVDVVEKLKIEHGICTNESLNSRADYDLFEFGSLDHDKVKEKEMAMIISARVEEIMFMIDKELKKIGKSGMLPAGAVFVGGSAKLPGVLEIARKYLRLPASLGLPYGLIAATDKINDPAYTTAISLVKWGADYVLEQQMHDSKSFSEKIKNIFGKFRL